MGAARHLVWALWTFVVYAGMSAAGAAFSALGALLILALVPALVGIVLVLRARHAVPERFRMTTVVATGAAVVWAIMQLTLFILAQPISVKGEPNRGLNQDPAGFIQAASNVTQSVLLVFVVVVVAIVLFALLNDTLAWITVGGAAITAATSFALLTHTFPESESAQAMLPLILLVGYGLMAGAASTGLLRPGGLRGSAEATEAT